MKSATHQPYQPYWVIFLLFLMTVITFMDRICISTASEDIMAELHINQQTMGYIFGIFALSYALFQIPSGWFADTYGPKKALVMVVSFWSVLTALTGAAWNVASLLIFRFLFGAGEAGAFPGASRAIYNWVNAKQRGLANGIFHSGGRVGAACTLFLMPRLIDWVGWRWTFVINGLIGLVWAAIWLGWFRDRPALGLAANGVAASRVNEHIKEELSTSEDPPFGLIITSPNMVLAMFQYIASSMTFFISLSWLFPYMKSQWGEGAETYAPIPLVLGMLAHWSSGALVTYLHGKGFHTGSRRIPAMIGFALAATGLILCTRVAGTSAAVFITCFSLAVFGVEMTIAPSWTFCLDIGGTMSGAVSGTMNMMGNLGSAASAVLFPYFTAHVTIPYLAEIPGTANAYFIFAAFLNMLAMFAWMGMNPLRQLDLFRSPASVRWRLTLFLVAIVSLFLSLYIYTVLKVK